MTRYTVIDTESWWCEDLHKAYKRLDPECEQRRIACRRIGAAAALDVEIDREGRVHVGTLASWTEHSHGTEQAVVTELFDFLRQREDRTVITWGGVATDVQILTLAAMSYGVALPPALLDTPGRKGPRRHCDLSLMMKGGGKTWHHLTEVALRLGVPVSLLEGKARVDRPVSAGAWAQVRGHCERDVLMTAIAKVGWLCAQGSDGLRLAPGVITLLAAFLRRRPEHEAADRLQAYLAELQQEIADEYGLAA